MQPRTSLLFVLLLLTVSGFTQTLKKIPISRSGCSLYSYCAIPQIETSKSRDSSVVYTGECSIDKLTYGVICVKLVNPPETLEQAEELLTAYLDYLKSSFGITQAAGYGKGHRLNKNESTRGLLDYWQDADKNRWKVKGWTNRYFIGVMYAYSQQELPEQKVNVFLDGLRFPE